MKTRKNIYQSYQKEINTKNNEVGKEEKIVILTSIINDDFPNVTPNMQEIRNLINDDMTNYEERAKNTALKQYGSSYTHSNLAKCLDEITIKAWINTIFKYFRSEEQIVLEVTLPYSIAN
jgi:uncharacterized protein YeeX (DUF496 family)